MTLSHIEQWGATVEELTAVCEADSIEDLLSRLQGAGVDVTFDPTKANKDNLELLKAVVQRLQVIGLAWALRQQNPIMFEWESKAEKFLEVLSEDLDRTGFTNIWNNKDAFALLMKLPRDESSAPLWQGLEQSSSLDELIRFLYLSEDDLSNASVNLEALKEKARRRKKLINICGKEFDSSDDNLSGLWNHISTGIPDEALDAFIPVDISKLESLTNVPMPTKKKREGKPTKPKPRQSKSMENLIGLSGEIHAYRMLQKTYGATLVNPSTWVSNNSTFVFPDNKTDDGYGYDFVFSLNGKIYYIEVKASEREDESFALGSSEIRFAMELARKRKHRRKEIFLVLRITNAMSEHPSFQILPNPYDPRYQPLFLVEDADARVRYKLS